MSAFARRIRGLELAFPLSGQQLHEPADLSEFVQLVHPALGPLQRIGSSQRSRASGAGAAGDTAVIITTGPQGFVRVVEYAEAQHDDPVARQIRYQLLPLGGSTIELQSSLFDAAGAAVATAVPYPLHRSIPLGPGDVLRVFAAVAAINIIDFRCVFIDYSAAEVPFLR